MKKLTKTLLASALLALSSLVYAAENNANSQNMYAECYLKDCGVSGFIADKVLMYVPNRIVDFFDIFSIRLDYGPQVKDGIQLTKAFGVGYGLGLSYGVQKGFDRTYAVTSKENNQVYFWCVGVGEEKQNNLFGNAPDYFHNYKGLQSFYSTIFARNNEDYWAIKVEGGLLLGYEFSIHPLNIADFICGIFCYDLLDNDWHLPISRD